TPKRFLEFVTAAHARRRLEESATLLEASWDSGLSGPGRLHDLFVTLEGVTPGEVRRRGEGLVLRSGVHASPFGRCFLAESDRGVNTVRFLGGREEDEMQTALAARWPAARITRDLAATGRTLERILDGLAGAAQPPLRLHLAGTNFQVRVWEALLHIP